jgi:hypothetical protein
MKAFLGDIKSSLAIAMLIVFGTVSLPTFAADSLAAGRKHAAKANQLAAKNKCKIAVVEFTKAYQSLKDPTILFNRAECQRKLGNNADALMDYELFVAEMPTAPNRASVEARIAVMREAVKAESAAVPVAPVAPAAIAATQTLQPAPSTAGDAKPPEKAPEPPAQRAEKWTD